GLTGLTEYQVRVKADCGDETSSYKTTTFTTPNCEATDACEYTFVLEDGYGDGWNDGYLTLEQSGVVVATVEAVNHNLGGEGSVDTVYVVLCDGNSIDLVWHEGGYDDEVSITLLDPDGVQIFTISDLSGITSPTIHTFTTDCGDAPQPEVCETPTGLHTTNLQNESIAIAWDANPDVASWNIQYRQTSGQLSSATSNTNSYTITGLTPGTEYQIQVQAVCTNGLTSEWCTAITASTTNVGIDSWLANSVTLYPNPAKEVVHVQCTMNNAQWDGASVEVLDVYGKLLQTVQMTSETTVLNVSGLADGMYFVRVTTEEGSVTKTFVKR
ncbi:MAG: fibronectin type III domain-containing protein, partial [Bacteroidales bacterium]|nr:fibronectin type III domain-containing protein [Bacteroidales bacterium]